MRSASDDDLTISLPSDHPAGELIHPSLETGSIVTIGVFDGIHAGHRALIAAAREEATRLGVPSVLVTFAPHPRAVVGPTGEAPARLTSVARRATLARAAGIDLVVVLHFDERRAAQAPEDFVADVLGGALRARGVVVGTNFTYGCRAQGTTSTLREAGRRSGFDVDVLDLVVLSAAEEATPVSSSSIRAAIAASDVAEATAALGTPVRVEGCVVHGAGRGGRDLGYPTANIDVDPAAAIPGDGVYAGWFALADEGDVEGSIVPGTWYPAAISVGTNPTFDGAHRTVEAYVLDEDAELYGRAAVVDVVDHVRGMERFSGVEELIAAMDRDVARVREILAPGRDAVIAPDFRIGKSPGTSDSAGV